LVGWITPAVDMRNTAGIQPVIIPCIAEIMVIAMTIGTAVSSETVRSTIIRCRLEIIYTIRGAHYSQHSQRHY